MSKARIIGAGAGIGRANGGGGYNTGGNQGGGDALEGLVSTTNMRVALVPYVRTRADGGNARNWVFCMNQLGGVGRRWGQAAGPGNRGGVHASCKDHAAQSRQRFPRRPKQSSGWGNPLVYRSNPVRLSAPSTSVPLDVAGYYGGGPLVPAPPPIAGLPPAFNIIILAFLTFDKASPFDAHFKMSTNGGKQGGSWEWTIPLKDVASLSLAEALDPKYLNDTNRPAAGAPPPEQKNYVPAPKQLMAAIETWKTKDNYQRERHVLISIGGGDGSNMSVLGTQENRDLATKAIKWFIDKLDLDGLDIDVEDNTDQTIYNNIAGVLRDLRAQKSTMKISCAPQGQGSEFGYYETAGILTLSDYIGVQFYNQGPMSFAAPRVDWNSFMGCPMIPKEGCGTNKIYNVPPPTNWLDKPQPPDGAKSEFADVQAIVYAAAQLTNWLKKPCGILAPGGPNAAPSGRFCADMQACDMGSLASQLIHAWDPKMRNWNNNSLYKLSYADSNRLYVGTWDVAWDYAAKNSGSVFCFSDAMKKVLDSVSGNQPPPPPPTGTSYQVSGNPAVNGTYIQASTGQKAPTTSFASHAYVLQGATDKTATPTLWSECDGSECTRPRWLLSYVDLTSGAPNITATPKNPVYFAFCTDVDTCKTIPQTLRSDTAGAGLITVTKIT